MQPFYFDSEADIRSLKADLYAVANWCTTWGMQLNVSKCKVMHIGQRNRRATYSLPDGNFRTSLGSTDNEKRSWDRALRQSKTKLSGRVRGIEGEQHPWNVTKIHSAPGIPRFGHHFIEFTFDPT